MANPIEVKVPDIGDFKDVEVIELLVKAGDAIDKEQSLVTLESDKATMEIPSPQAGVVKELKLKLGDKVSQGALILLLEAGAGAAKAEAKAEAAAPKPAAAPAAKAPAEPAHVAPPPVPSDLSDEVPPLPPAHTRPVPRMPRDEVVAKPHASPSVRRFARELGVDLGRVQGSGPKGRIVHGDVQGFVKSALAGTAPASLPASGIFQIAGRKQRAVHRVALS